MAKNEQKKAAALEALMQSSTLTEAAQKAGISRKTLYSYIRDDHAFSLAYKSLQEEASIRALEALEEQRERASSVVLSIMEDEKQPAAVRLKAALSILNAGAKQREDVYGIAAAHASDNQFGHFFGN